MEDGPGQSGGSMTLSMLDRILYFLACGHMVVLGRLDKAYQWTCEQCGKDTDLTKDPYRTELENDRRTADQIDTQARQRGETTTRAFPGSETMDNMSPQVAQAYKEATDNLMYPKKEQVQMTYYT